MDVSPVTYLWNRLVDWTIKDLSALERFFIQEVSIIEVSALQASELERYLALSALDRCL